MDETAIIPFNERDDVGIVPYRPNTPNDTN